MSGETRISLTPKDHPSGLYTTRRVTRNRAFYGEIRHYRKTRLSIYWAKRKTDERFHADPSWAIDVDTIEKIKSYAVKFVGIEVEDGTKLIAPIDLFRSGVAGVHVRNFDGHVGRKGKIGARQFYVEERLWAIKRPPIEEREETLLERMSFKKRA